MVSVYVYDKCSNGVKRQIADRTRQLLDADNFGAVLLGRVNLCVKLLVQSSNKF